MRCDEVIHELAVPTDDRDRTALAEHLAGCPSCAEWNRRAVLLDQLWDTTRPAEPSPEAWNSVWSNINQALQPPSADREFAGSPMLVGSGDSPKIVLHSASASSSTEAPIRPRTRRFVTIVLMVGLAQAAAILIALGLGWRVQPVAKPHQNPQIAQIPTPPVPGVAKPIRVNQAVIVTAEIDIEEGHQIMIRVDGSAPKLVDVTPPEMTFGGIVNKTPGYVEMFNAVESFAKTVVAAQ